MFDADLEIQGEITSILSKYKDSYVLRVKLDDQSEVAVLIGFNMLAGPRLYEGESIRATGKFEFSFAHGDQFHCEKVERLPLDEAHLIVQWLAKNKYIQGVGAQTGKKLIATYGDQLVHVLNEGNVEAISKDTNISPSKILTLTMAWKQYMGEMASVNYLIEMKLPYKLAMNCINAWGKKVESMLTYNPYYLSAFWDFDKLDDFVLERWKLKKNDPRRITACAEDILISRYNSAGDTAMTGSELSAKMETLLGVGVSAIPSGQDFITLNDRGDYQATGPFFMERYVHNRLKDIKDHQCNFKRLFDEKKLDAYEKTLDFLLNNKQKEAVKSAVSNPVSIIRGGAGTGKTTVLEAIIDQYKGSKRKLILTAPTGKAALRMTEATGCEAKTIAKFIFEVLRNRDVVSFHNVVVIIDEASMVDLPTIYGLLSKLPNDINLIVVGDERQLAPIGAGLFFHLIVNETCWIPQVKLDQTVRQDASSGIPAVADSILKYQIPNIAPMIKLMREGCAFREIVDNETRLENAAKLYAKLIEKHENVQIIAATRRGVAKLNSLAQAIVNPLPKEKYHSHLLEHSNKSRFIAKDKVVFNENDYRRGLTNGALGIVIEVYPETKLATVDGVVVLHVMRIRFDDLVKDELFDGANDVYITEDEFKSEKVSLAYAITCHKSQGSQYSSTVIVLDSPRLVDNSWLYTAITRARNACYVLGKGSQLNNAATSMSKASERLTGVVYGQL